MNANRLTVVDMPWLPRLSADFKQRLAAIQADEVLDWAPGLLSLSQQALGMTQAMSLSRALNQLRTKRPSKQLTPFKLGLVSNGTVDFVLPWLQATALRYGISLEVVTSAFGQVSQAALDPASGINTARPDAVLIALDHRGLPFRSEGDASWPAFRADVALHEIEAIREGFGRHGGSTCLVQSVPAPVAPLFGSLDAALDGSARAAVAEYNTRLAKGLAASGDLLVDIDALAQTVGLDIWYDDRDWNLAKLPFSQRALPLYADHVMRVVAAMRGKARKCLVLDLDNTLWGGVIGDDGVEGIAVDQGDPRGEAHRSMQAMALDLRRRGIVLAVCSKNDEATARLPFVQHPGMLLKDSDFAVFMANWDDKATNLERIARRLDLGLDALVFVDDNPVERSQVRQALPQVAIPELGDDPSGYARTVMLAGYFESVAFTPEDLARADQYQGNAHRAELLESSRDMGQFLQSLGMRIRFAPFEPQARKRITQLINKTNQFNVTARRYTEAQVVEMESSADVYTLQVGLIDRFGDNGMISVVICRCQPDAWEIDSWLMSCRVLNRKVEESVCNRIARDAMAAGAMRLVGRYVPTARNNIVAQLFERLGFTRSADGAEVACWELDLRTFEPFEVPVVEAG